MTLQSVELWCTFPPRSSSDGIGGWLGLTCGYETPAVDQKLRTLASRFARVTGRDGWSLIKSNKLLWVASRVSQHTHVTVCLLHPSLLDRSCKSQDGSATAWHLGGCDLHPDRHLDHLDLECDAPGLLRCWWNAPSSCGLLYPCYFCPALKLARSFWPSVPGGKRIGSGWR